jgi:hypothetical protein
MVRSGYAVHIQPGNVSTRACHITSRGWSSSGLRLVTELRAPSRFVAKAKAIQTDVTQIADSNRPPRGWLSESPMEATKTTAILKAIAASRASNLPKCLATAKTATAARALSSRTYHPRASPNTMMNNGTPNCFSFHGFVPIRAHLASCSLYACVGRLDSGYCATVTTKRRT